MTELGKLANFHYHCNTNQFHKFLSVSIWICSICLVCLSRCLVRKRSCFLNGGTIEEAAKADHKLASWTRLARSTPELDLVESQHIQVVTVTSILLDWPYLKLRVFRFKVNWAVVEKTWMAQQFRMLKQRKKQPRPLRQAEFISLHL